MKEHIIRANLYQNGQVEWEDAEHSSHFNVHQKTRQFLEAKLKDFLLGDGEVLLAAFEKVEEGETNHENPDLMHKVADAENGAFYRIQIPSLVHNTPGAWNVQFFLATDYDKLTGGYSICYPFGELTFVEYSSIMDDGLTVPTADNLKQLREDYKAVIESKDIVLTSADSAQISAMRAQESAALAAVSAEQAADSATASSESAAEAELYANELKSAVDMSYQVWGMSAKNTADIDFLKSVTLKDGTYHILETQQAYTERVTADGANIVDGATAIVKRIDGESAKSLNYFDGTRLLDDDNTTFTRTVKEGGRVVVFDRKTSGYPNIGFCKVVNVCPDLRVGQKVYVRFDSTYPEKGFLWGGLSGLQSQNTLYTLTQAMINGAISVYINGTAGIQTTISNFRIITEKGQVYTPYYKGFKHPTISGIESKNADGTEIDSFVLPETLELAKYDSFTPLTGELKRATAMATIDGVNLKSISYSLSTLNGRNYHVHATNVGSASSPFDYKSGDEYPMMNNYPDCKTTGLPGENDSWGMYIGEVDGGSTVYLWFDVESFALADVSTVEGCNEYLQALNTADRPLTVEYKTTQVTIEKLIGSSVVYKAFKNGTETVLGNEDSEWVENTLTQEYYAIEGGETDNE